MKREIILESIAEVQNVLPEKIVTEVKPFEVFYTAEAYHVLPACPHCGAEQVEKLVSLPAAPGKSAGIIASARKQAAKEGHFSNYSNADRARAKG